MGMYHMYYKILNSVNCTYILGTGLMATIYFVLVTPYNIDLYDKPSVGKENLPCIHLTCHKFILDALVQVGPDISFTLLTGVLP